MLQQFSVIYPTEIKNLEQSTTQVDCEKQMLHVTISLFFKPISKLDSCKYPIHRLIELTIEPAINKELLV